MCFPLIDTDKINFIHPILGFVFSEFIFCLGHGGGWGYSGHSIEAIRFMADTDILLGGFGLFGGRGEYTAKLKVYFTEYIFWLL